MSNLVNQCIRCYAFFCVVCSGVFVTGLSFIFIVGDLNATEWSLNSSLRGHYGYNDNMFLTLQPHDGVSNVVVQPDINFSAKEKNWDTLFNARLRSNNYSDSDLNSNEQYYMAYGSYKRERDTYSIKGAYNLKSSLDVESETFGITKERIIHKTITLTPSYTYMMTERLKASFAYAITESRYDDSVSAKFISYRVDTGSVTLAYVLSERNSLNVSAKYTDYLSLDGLSEYQMLTLGMGLSRQFTETFKASFQVGSSERDSSNQQPEFTFLGTTIIQTPDTGSNNSYVFDASFDLKTESGMLTGKLSQDNVTSSYGGLDVVNKVSLGYKQKLSKRWGYALNGNYEKTESDRSSTSFTDRNLFFINTNVDYSLDRDWKIVVSWRYLEREFTEENQVDVPVSNKFYIGMTYRFSELSTF